MTEVLDSKLLVRTQNDIPQISFDNIVPIFKYWYGIITVECFSLFQSVYLQLPKALCASASERVINPVLCYVCDCSH